MAARPRRSRSPGALKREVSRVWRITGHLGTAPECTVADSTFANANPLPLTPSWGHKATLYVFHLAWDGLPTFTYWNFPRDHRLVEHVAASGGAAGDVKQASCGFQHSGKSLRLDPRPPTSGAANWRALTIGIEPAADVDPNPAIYQDQYGVDA